MHSKRTRGIRTTAPLQHLSRLLDCPFALAELNRLALIDIRSAGLGKWVNAIEHQQPFSRNKQSRFARDNAQRRRAEIQPTTTFDRHR